jgi:hypothetical protein
MKMDPIHEENVKKIKDKIKEINHEIHEIREKNKLIKLLAPDEDWIAFEKEYIKDKDI